jgi:hypothetical protein
MCVSLNILTNRGLTRSQAQVKSEDARAIPWFPLMASSVTANAQYVLAVHRKIRTAFTSWVQTKSLLRQ